MPENIFLEYMFLCGNPQKDRTSFTTILAGFYFSISCGLLYNMEFPKMGIPQNHPFIDHSFHEINHPALGCHMRKPPYVDMHISYIDPEPPRNEG